MAKSKRKQASLVMEEQEIGMLYQYAEAQTILTWRAFQGKKGKKNIAKDPILDSR